jgi:hypothetical protein
MNNDPITARKAWAKASLEMVELSAYVNGQALQQLSPQLRKLRQNGIDAIQLPIHWGMIAPFCPEQLQQKQSWSGLKSLAKHLLKHGFKLQFQLFFASDEQSGQQLHLPNWCWQQFSQNLSAEQSLDAPKFVDSYGVVSPHAVAPWAGLSVTKVFSQWLNAFTEHMAEFALETQAISLALGPQGETRPPCFERDSQGRFQSFSPSALAELAQSMTEQHGSEQDWLKAWDLDAASNWKTRLVELLAEDYQQQHKSVRWQQFCLWYSEQWQRYVGLVLNQANLSLQGKWQHCHLALTLPLLEKSTSQHPWLACFTGLNPIPWEEAKVQQDYQIAQFERWKQQANDRLLLVFSGGESSQAWHSSLPMLTAQRQLHISALVQNQASGALNNHPGWDQLYQAVLRHEGMVGWLFNDMSQLQDQAIVKGRLAQLNKLKYERAKARQIAKKQFRVMGPLHLKVANQKQMLEEENWQEFEQQLLSLREIGVTAISTDIWWGLVEGDKPGNFDWSYYDRVVALLKSIGLQWVPILSFHQAGGNVNDDFMQAIPLWLWGRLLESNDQVNSVQDLQYVSETGDASMEYVSLWADEFVMPYYERFMQQFAKHFANKAGLMDEINISLGPAGELRYPSYNAHDWGNYPNRGTMQCYSRLAQLDWLDHLKQKFHHISALNACFGTTHQSFEDAIMPDAEWVFTHQRYIHNAWAREFLNWYNQALVNHGRRIVDLSLNCFDKAIFAGVHLGVKIPGIHWVVSDPDTPRAAEITAGLIATHPTLNSSNQQEYLRLLKGLLPEGQHDRIAIHFTCLEMINKDYEGYSRAADLVDWVANAAAECQVALMGENALAGELYGKQGWSQMARALLRDPGYDGLTLLRMQNFFDDDTTPFRELQKLINRC